MKKKIKGNCLLLAVLLLAQVLLEPLAIFANNYGQNPGIFSGGGQTLQEDLFTRDKTIDASRACYDLDLKEYQVNGHGNLALQIAWRIHKGQTPGKVFSIALPAGLTLTTSSAQIGTVVQNQINILDVYYNQNHIEFYLREEGALAAQKGELYGSHLLLPIYGKESLVNQSLNFEVQEANQEYYIDDFIDSISQEDLFSYRDSIVRPEQEQIKQEDQIEQEEKNQEDLNQTIEITEPDPKEDQKELYIESSSPKEVTKDTKEKNKESIFTTVRDFLTKNSDKEIIEEPSQELQAISLLEDSKTNVQENPSKLEEKETKTLVTPEENPLALEEDPVAISGKDPGSAEENPFIQEEGKKEEVEEISPDLPIIEEKPQEEDPWLNPEPAQDQTPLAKEEARLVEAPGIDILLKAKIDGEDLTYLRPRFNLYKSVKRMDAFGNISEEEKLIGHYRADELASLVFPNVKDGNYRLVKEGEDLLGVEFTVENRQLIYKGQLIPDNILDLSQEKAQDLKNTDQLSKIEISLTDKDGKAIDSRGAIYRVLKIEEDGEKIIQDLNWDLAQVYKEAPKVVEDEKDLTLSYLEQFLAQKLEPEEEKEPPLGQVQSLSLPEGEYILREVQAPKGYEPTGGSFKVIVEKGLPKLETKAQEENTLDSKEKPIEIQEEKPEENREVALASIKASLEKYLEEEKMGQESWTENKEIRAQSLDLKEEAPKTTEGPESLHVRAMSPGPEEKIRAEVVQEGSPERPTKINVAYLADGEGGDKATLKIQTVNEAGSPLYYGGASTQEIGNLRDKNLNHDATYAVYKYDEESKTYKPLPLYDRPLKEGEAGPAEKVNWKHGHLGEVTLDGLDQGKYLVKEVKSVFQYAFKNLAMTFDVQAGKVTNLQEVQVQKADYENDRQNRVKLTYNQKMDLDSKRSIAPGEITPASTGNVQINEDQSVKAIYHKGNLRVKKVDKNGNPIPGVALELHGHDANRNLRIYRVITNAEGIAEFKDLNVPSYHLLKEVETPGDYALPNHQWMIYFGEGTWIEFDDNNKPKTEHIPLQISDNQVYATQVELKPVIKLNPQETRQVIENDKYRPLIDGVTGASIAPKNWFQFTGINNPTNAPAEGTSDAEKFWATNWNKEAYFTDGQYKQDFFNSRDKRFLEKRQTLGRVEGSEFYTMTINNNPRAKVVINKKASDTGNILPGATFSLYKADENGNLLLENGQPVYMKKGLNPWTEVSGLDGKAVFDNIPEGNYVIKETQAPGGYQGSQEEYKIRVDGEGNITFINSVDAENQIYGGKDSAGSFDYTETNIFGQTTVQERYTVSSKITEINREKNEYTQTFYLTCKDMLNNEDLSIASGTVITNLTVYPYTYYYGQGFNQDHVGQGNSSAQSIKSYQVYGVSSTATNPFPEDYKINLESGQYQDLGSGTGSSIRFQNIASSKGVVVKVVGTYDPNKDKPIISQGVFSEDDLYAYSTSGVALTSTDQEQQGKGELDFTVTNTRYPETPLDKKGTVNLRKVVSGTDTLLGGAKFALYVGKYDEIGPRPEAFVTGETSPTGLPGVEVGGKPGNLQFKDIPPGTYTLKETAAPDGYEKTLHSWTVRVFPSGVTLINLNPTFDEDPTLEEPVNVNDKVHLDRDSFSFGVDLTTRDAGSRKDKNILYPNQSEFYKMDFKLQLDNGIKKGNYFTIQLDPDLSLEGTMKETNLPDIEYGGYVLATGQKDMEKNTITYTFTEVVNSLSNISVDFHISISPNRYTVLNSGPKTYQVKVANDTPIQTPSDVSIDYNPFVNNGGYFFWYDDAYSPSYYARNAASGFIQRIDNEKGNIEMTFYLRSLLEENGQNKYLQVKDSDSSGKDYNLIPPITNFKYELYKVNEKVTVDADKYSPLMPKSYGVNFSDTSKYTLLSQGNLPDNGIVSIPQENWNDDVILRVIAPYKVEEETARLQVWSYYLNPYGQWQTVGITSGTVTKPSQIFTQANLTQGEALAFNKEKGDMDIQVYKKNEEKKIIQVGSMEMKLSVAEDASGTVPVPEDQSSFTLSLGGTDPLTINLPQGLNGEYILSETKAPVSYLVNGLRYRIKVDAKGRKVYLLEVKDASGQPVDYKFFKGATEESVSRENPAILYSESVNADGKIVVDQDRIALDIIDPSGAYPMTGGMGTRIFYGLGALVMVLSVAFLYRRKRLDMYGREG